MCPDPAVPVPTTETAIDPPSRRPGDAVRAAIADRQDHLQAIHADLVADLQRQHAALDAKTADILYIEAQLAELAGVRYAVIPAGATVADDERGFRRWAAALTTAAQRAAHDAPQSPTRSPWDDLAAQFSFASTATAAQQAEEQLVEMAAARGLTVVDVEQHRWLQGVATRAGAMAGSREDAWAALHRVLWPLDPCTDLHASIAPRAHASINAVLDYLAGGR